MTCSSPRLAASIGAAVLLTAASALAQLPSPEQRAFGAVDREAMTSAAGHVLEAAESALTAFYAADRARDDAAAHYQGRTSRFLPS